MNQTENRKEWYQNSILVKLGVITAVILILQIPAAFIQNLTTDREGYEQEVRKSDADKWSGDQLIQGPVLIIPYKKTITETGSDKKLTEREITEMAYILPQLLRIKADIKTQLFQSGVYDDVVYNSKIMVSGTFDKLDLSQLSVDPKQLMYDKARLVFSVSDMKGLKNNPVVKIGDKNFVPEPAVSGFIPFDKGLQANIALQNGGNFDFSYQLDIKGSQDLNFLNTGKTTDLEIASDWKNPAFNGRYLPDTCVTSQKGLNAKWHMLYYNRPFPQQWANDDSVLTNKKAKADAVFGLRMQLPIDQYRKVLRTTKYSTLIILLTFASLFLTELIRKTRIHLFNYILIGAAMIVYYTLLLSFSEQIGYNYAYLLSSASTISLIAIFTASLLKNKIAAGLFAVILSVFYGFIFIIVQLEELSLLFGSIALFVIVALLMYFSRRINWNDH